MSGFGALLRPEGRRWWVRLGIAAGLSSVLGVALCSRAPREQSVQLFGRALPSGPNAAEALLDVLEQQMSTELTLQLPDGIERRVPLRRLGLELDRERWTQLVSGTQRRGRESERPTPIELIAPVHLDVEQALPALLSLKDELDRAPRDARLDLERQAVVPERAGRFLDVDRSLLAIRRAVEAGEDRVALVFEELMPHRLAAQLQAIQHAIVLGSFETPYDPADRAQDRTFNLRLAASRLDGYVLFPGEEFDFNAVVGPRDEANGYRVAKVIARGELVDGIGGGTCQISGTLHAAALFAGLDLLERHPHTRPSSYIKLGFDAAVVYPTMNLRLRNPYDFPVVLRETVEHGRVRAEVRGARRPYAITVLRRIDGAHPFEELQRPDPTLPRGTRVLAQRGVPGFDLHRYRIRRDGSHAVRETFIDRYPPTAQVVLIGTGERASAAGRPQAGGDAQPEYLADELLVLSQPAEPEGPLQQQRTPGRFATPGWTRTIGAPVWSP